MSMTLTRAAYERLIKEDIEEVLRHMPPSLERMHVIDVLSRSVKLQYDEVPGSGKRWADSYGPDDDA